MSDEFKRQAAAAALAEIRPGMKLGLGTGSTARHLVDLLGDMTRDGFECLCVPTSEATAAQYPRPGVVYRPVRDARPMPVWLAWWRDDPPALRSALVRLACDLYSA
jgi:ribose 5-phosphate isomerase